MRQTVTKDQIKKLANYFADFYVNCGEAFYDVEDIRKNVKETLEILNVKYPNLKSTIKESDFFIEP